MPLSDAAASADNPNVNDLTAYAGSPIRIIISMYDRAISQMEAGRFGIDHDDPIIKSDNLQRAQRTVLELMSCLNMDQGGELAQNLIELYSYILNELAEANLASRVEPVDRCMRMMEFLRQTWSDVEQSTGSASHVPMAA